MDYALSDDEIYTICNALNTHASDLEKDAKRRRAKGHTYQQIEVVEEEVRKLRALTKRLIDEKNADVMDDFNYVGSRHHY